MNGKVTSLPAPQVQSDFEMEQEDKCQRVIQDLRLGKAKKKKASGTARALVDIE